MQKRNGAAWLERGGRQIYGVRAKAHDQLGQIETPSCSPLGPSGSAG